MWTSDALGIVVFSQVPIFPDAAGVLPILFAVLDHGLMKIAGLNHD